MIPPDFHSADVSYGGKQSRGVRHSFVIVVGFARLDTVDVVRRVEEKVVVEGHTLETPPLTLGSAAWDLPPAPLL